jgi:hypothetical protein
MSKPKPTLPVQRDAAIESLDAESDRGAAVLAGSLVENALGQYLERYCAAKAVKPRLVGHTAEVCTVRTLTIKHAPHPFPLRRHQQPSHALPTRRRRQAAAPATRLARVVARLAAGHVAAGGQV